jgi:hypothetical protein
MDATDGCPTCAGTDTAIGGVVNVDLGLDAAWGGAAATGKAIGCGIVGAGRGALSFFGFYPAWASPNLPPGYSTVVRGGRGIYTIGTPGIIYQLSKLGPVGRAAADLVPGFGEILMTGQATLAAYDGSKALHDCASKAK